VVRRFFENLLPEGDALDAAAASSKVSKSNVTALLVALGREMAGAITISAECRRHIEWAAMIPGVDLAP
jgi:serine/threonine-protein kinase HipA